VSPAVSIVTGGVCAATLRQAMAITRRILAQLLTESAHIRGLTHDDFLHGIKELGASGIGWKSSIALSA
jgi:hypothetical protein